MPMSSMPFGSKASIPPLWLGNGCGMVSRMRSEAGSAKRSFAWNSLMTVAPSGLRV